MEILSNINDCCGCSACMQACPQKCITMKMNYEGFLYPFINENNCIVCRKCQSVCPILNEKQSISPKRVFAYKCNDNTIVENSSSGGAFSYFATEIIKRKGHVIGAGFDQQWHLCHQDINNINDLDILRRSKYIQSEINNMYKRTSDLLKQNIPVLFTGTPCQIAGLKSYLRKDYENLYTIDVICHGVPSPMVFKNYIKEITNYKRCNITTNPLKCINSNRKEPKPITEINFRYKKKSENKSWRLFSLRLKFKDKNKEGIVTNTWKTDIYLKGFLDHLYLRKSCHQCQFRSQKSSSDITIGDFWGIEKLSPKTDDDTGINLIIVNTNKGYKLCTDMNSIIECKYYDVNKTNSALEQSPKAHIMREYFFKNYKRKGMLFTTLLCIQQSFTAMILRKFLIKKRIK